MIVIGNALRTLASRFDAIWIASGPMGTVLPSRSASPCRVRAGSASPGVARAGSGPTTTAVVREIEVATPSNTAGSSSTTTAAAFVDGMFLDLDNDTAEALKFAQCMRTPLGLATIRSRARPARVRRATDA